jgi:hypothetical protein
MPIDASRIHFLSIFLSIVLFVPGVRAADNEIPFKVIFQGVSDKDLLSDIQSISDTFNDTDNKVASSYLLQKMADNDNRKFLQLLRARGFYNSSIESDVNVKVKSLELTFRFQTGIRYMLRSVKLEFTDLTDEPRSDSLISRVSDCIWTDPFHPSQYLMARIN